MTASGDSAGTAPTLGARVLTADDEDLGTVKEISGRCFKVDAPLAPDYWLGHDTIAGADGGALRLAFTRARLTEERSDGPAHGGLHRHETLLI
jgi:hypothetical protein